MSTLPVSLVLPVFEFECWLRSGFSIKGCKSLISSAVLHAHRFNVHYCYYSSLVNQRSRDQTISHHTRWKLKQLNMSWVTQTYSTTFSYFEDGVFSPAFFIALLMQWVHEELFLFLYKDTTTFVGMRGREWLESKREICWRMHWSGFKWRFLPSACVLQKKMKTVTIISYGLSDRIVWSFPVEFA